MSTFIQRYKWYLMVLGVLAVVIFLWIYSLQVQEERLPIYQPNQFNPELVDDSMIRKKSFHTIGEWSLTNQYGETVTQDHYAGKIYVSDFFFTTCRTICPIMTGNMLRVQEDAPDDVLILSHSVTPDTDTPAVLLDYAKKKGVNGDRWNLVTGDKREIFELARKRYFAAKTLAVDDPYAMVHTENFTLIDKEGRIRGWYDGTNEEEIDELLKDIETLRGEYGE